MASDGKRFEVIVLEVKRNNESAVKELVQLQDYFEKHFKEKYVIVAAEYGRPNKVFPKLFHKLFLLDLIDNPKNLLFNMNKVFIENNKVSSLLVGDMGWISEVKIFIDKFKGDKN